MRLTCLSRVRNESDVIASFVRHVAALVDDLVIVDEGSVDGTLAFLRAASAVHGNVHVYESDPARAVELDLVARMVRECRELRDADWVVLLDAGEFLDVEGPDDLASLLAAQPGATAVCVPSRVVVPVRLDDRVFDIDEEVWCPATSTETTTLAARPGWLEQGDGSEAGEVLVAGPTVLRVPVRSRSQLALSALQEAGLRGTAPGTVRRDAPAPWAMIAEAHRAAALTDDRLRAFGARWATGRHGDGIMSDEDLEREGFALRPLSVPAVEPPIDVPQDPDDARRTIALVSASPAQAASPSRGSDEPAFPTLPAREQPAERRDDHELLLDFLEPQSWSIRSLVPSAWNGHIPLMFSIVTAVRPRRFVELGTHHGASFLAACQAVERLGLDTECIAVDTWRGDEHAGFYDETVYGEFLNRVDVLGYERVTPLRMLFAEAARGFEPGSVDLLHIDGLHTYEAVRQDLETWLPKLTEDAVVLLHDTNVHERDFGVWRLFDELQLDDEFLTFNFRHSHGLGVLVRHGAVEQPVGRLVQRLTASRRDAEYVQLASETAGARAVAAARMRELDRELDGNPHEWRNRVTRAEEQVSQARLELQRERGRVTEAERRLERATSQLADLEARFGEARKAQSDLRWFLQRLDSSPFGPLLRRFGGFRTLRSRWLDS